MLTRENKRNIMDKVIKTKAKTTKSAIITYTPGRIYTVKLRGKRLSKGKISLYLDHYRGANQKREFEFLNIIIVDNPTTTDEREYKEEKMKLALDIRQKRESHLDHSKEGLISPDKKRINFIEYYQAYLQSYSNKDIRIVRYSLEKFKLFVGVDYIAPHQVDDELVKKFRNYLQDNLNGETPLNYFTKFKSVCKKAVKERILNDNPCDGITIKRDNSVKKAIFSYSEIGRLAQTECSVNEVKRAFLFACNTALGFSELSEVRWCDIDFESRKLITQRLKVRNSSSNSINFIYLNQNALSLLGEPGQPKEKVFKLKTYQSSNKILKSWAAKAGMTKNITWHSARHSVATNLLINNVDLKTVSSVLTHSSLKHTAKYLHLVDDLKDAAFNSIPNYEIGEEVAK